MGLPKKDVIQLTSSMKKLDFSHQLSDISCPTLILCGEKDKPNRKAAEQLSSLINGAKLEIIKQAGHEANVDNPEGLGEIIKIFLESDSIIPILKRLHKVESIKFTTFMKPSFYTKAIIAAPV